MGDALDKAKDDKHFNLVLQGIYHQGVTIWAPTLDEALAKLPEPGGDGKWDDMERVEGTTEVVVSACDDEDRELLSLKDVPHTLILSLEDLNTLEKLYSAGADTAYAEEFPVDSIYRVYDKLKKARGESNA